MTSSFFSKTVRSSVPSNKLLRGALILTIGQMASYGLSFARNIILARLLTKSDFGLAAVFGMTLSLLEIAGRMSFGGQLVQSKNGDAESFQASSHAFQFVFSVAGALLMVSLSYPMAHAFNVPQLTWAFALLGGIPFARGFEHLDQFRLQRAMNYLPAVTCELVPQVVVTLAVWPLTVWLGDFRVIVWLTLGKAVLGILTTHWIAQRPYRWAWRQDHMKSMWLFGWPLLLNGLLLFASQQADQLVVGAFLSLDELAAYALVLSLVSIPWFIFGKTGSSIMLPILSRVQDDPEGFRWHYRACVAYASLGAVVFTLPLIVAGEQLVGLLFGSKYHGSGMLMAFLGAAFAVRFLRFVPAVAATARADTMNHLYSNLWRVAGFPLAVTVALLGGGATLIAGCAIVGEVVATVVSLLRLRRCQGVPLRDTAAPAAYIVGFLFTELTLVHFGSSQWDYWLASWGVVGLLAIAVGAAWIALPGFAGSVKEAVRHRTLGRVEKAAP